MFGKFNIADTLRQYGINPCTIVEGRNADAQFPFSDWNREQLRQVNHLVDHIYTGFVQKVMLITELPSLKYLTPECQLLNVLVFLRKWAFQRQCWVPLS